MSEKTMIHNLHATICKDNGNLESLNEKSFKIKYHNGFAIIGVDYFNDSIKRYNHSQLRDFLMAFGIFESVLLSTYGKIDSSCTAFLSNMKQLPKNRHQKFTDINKALSLLGVVKINGLDEFNSINLGDYPQLLDLIT